KISLHRPHSNPYADCGFFRLTHDKLPKSHPPMSLRSGAKNIGIISSTLSLYQKLSRMTPLSIS
ncbi:MAG: hypothetical protein KAI61_05870, partial [Alphaproteobacteria bacterium]|nr:hypothetical protein [Alphaproteobacteria bacterium]